MMYWTLIRDGKPKPEVYKTKRSLLISYDMMPLIGLRNMEKSLISRGYILTKVHVVKDETGPFWAMMRNGKLDLQSESLAQNEEGAFSLAAIRENLHWFTFSTTGNICPKRTTKARAKTIGQLKTRGFQAVRVRLEPSESY